MNTSVGNAIKVIETEKACVLRNENSMCDRNCAVCDLVLNVNDILSSYDLTVKALKLYGTILDDDGK